MESVKVNKALIDKIKAERKNNSLTQKDMADYLEINLSKYQRFEAYKFDNFEKEYIKKILSKLNIDESFLDNSLTASPTSLKSIRIKNEFIDELKVIEMTNNFESFSQTVNYIIEQYLTNHKINLVRYELEDLIKESIFTTWATSIKDINKELISNKKFLDYIIKEYNLDEKELRNNFNFEEMKRKNMSKW